MGFYLYGLVSDPPRGGATPAGLAREPLREVRCGRGLTAIVGEMPSRPVVTMKTIRGHDATVRRLAGQAAAILPARFGIYLETLSGIREAVALRAVDLRTALQRVTGREQMTLRLTDRQPARQPSRSVRHLARAASGVRSGGEGTRHLIERAADLRGQAAAPELDPVREALSPLLADERVKRGRPPLVLTAYHLIDRGAAPRYRRLVRRAALAPRFSIRITGPFPPNGFAPAWLD